MDKLDVLILTGGQGSRLRNVVSDRPKPMADIQGRPFLDILINHVASFGSHRFILCTGFMADSIERYYEKADQPYTLLFSREAIPLGTGGAIKNAEPLIASNPFLVLNGDSLCRADIKDFFYFHVGKKALLSLVVTGVNESGDFGSIAMDGKDRITGFLEKGSSGRSLINAGIYLLDSKVLSLIPTQSQFSLEHDLFPALVGKDFFGFLTKEALIDIGTPERYEQAQRLL
jgi:D-glycero-alpha-D-manno-heptose 1-phosphate guanylyltransferase